MFVRKGKNKKTQKGDNDTEADGDVCPWEKKILIDRPDSGIAEMSRDEGQRRATVT